MSENIVTGILTHNLKTLEEIRYETSETEEGKHERRFYLLRERTKYYYSVSQSICDVGNKFHGTIHFAKSMGLICEAANIVFMRAIAIRRYEGLFCFKTVLSNGKKCRNYYVSKICKRIVNGEKMDIMVIYRSITDHKEYSMTTTCSFTRAGQMIDLFWSNSNYFLHVDPDLNIYGNMVEEGKVVGLDRHWNRDKQIFSFYLDQKVRHEANIRAQKINEQSMRRMSADWLQFLLNTKPQDTVCSSIKFFTIFGTGDVSCKLKQKDLSDKSHPLVSEKEKNNRN